MTEPTSHYEQLAEELVTQDRIDLLNQMAGSNISRQAGVAFIEQMLEAGNFADLLKQRDEFERIVRSNIDNLTRLADDADQPIATPEELAAIESAKQTLITAFHLL